MKKRLIFFCLAFCLLFLMACGKKEQVDKSRIYKIYAVNKDETRIFCNEYTAENADRDLLIEELMGQLSKTPEKLEYKAPLAGNFKLLNYSVEESQLILNFDEHYKEQPVTTETLVRAAIVRTLTQIKGISHVSFQVRSDPLTDSADNVIGIMSADMFIDNAGSEINSYEKVTLRLYFANEDGDKLVETNMQLDYNTNISMEKLVVEQLIKGPGEQLKGKAYPIINPETKVIGVTVKDGTCYVNMNESFLTQIYNVNSDVTIYSLVNSLIELPNVNKVQIAVDGESNIMYRENVNLSVLFERNLDIVTYAEK